METTRAVAWSWSWSKGKAHSICDAPAVESSQGGRLLGVSHDRPTWPCHLNRASSLSHPFLLQPLIDSTPSPAKQNLAYKTCRFSEAVPAHLQPSPSSHPQQSSFIHGIVPVASIVPTPFSQTSPDATILFLLLLLRLCPRLCPVWAGLGFDASGPPTRFTRRNDQIRVVAIVKSSENAGVDRKQGSWLGWRSRRTWTG